MVNLALCVYSYAGVVWWGTGVGRRLEGFIGQCWAISSEGDFIFFLLFLFVQLSVLCYPIVVQLVLYWMILIHISLP